MRLYAERPGRFGLQLLSDVLALAWVLAVVWLATTAQAFLLTLQEPGRALTRAGETVRGTFDGAAQGASEIPFVGSRLAAALAPGSDAGASLIGAGTQVVDTVAGIALGALVLVLVLGLLPVLALWLPLRVRYARAAGAAVAARRAGGDLLALRALTRRKLRGLTGGTDPATAWRERDPAVVAALADRELRALGLRPLARTAPEPVA